MFTQSGPRSAGAPRHIPWAGGLLCFPFFFFSICDICSVLVPPLIPNPTQLCRPPALCRSRSALSIRPF